MTPASPPFTLRDLLKNLGPLDNGFLAVLGLAVMTLVTAAFLSKGERRSACGRLISTLALLTLSWGVAGYAVEMVRQQNVWSHGTNAINLGK